MLMGTGFTTNSAGAVLIAFAERQAGVAWVQTVDDALRPEGFVIWKEHSTRGAIQRVESGEVKAAVLSNDPMGFDGLSVLRIIRSIDQALPCWLVTGESDRRTLETALSMRAISVLSHPVNGSELTIALKRAVLGQ